MTRAEGDTLSICAGSGEYPVERVILDTVPGMNPRGTCPTCTVDRIGVFSCPDWSKYNVPTTTMDDDGPSA